MSYRNHVLELYHMFYLGRALEAFDQFYHKDVIMVDANGAVREGKVNYREHKQKYLSSIREIHDGGIESVTADERNGITMVESWLDVSFHDGSRVRVMEIARQRWEGNQIKEEYFYRRLSHQVLRNTKLRKSRRMAVKTT